MRKAFDRQQRMDRPTISNVPLNLGCRDEIVPILAALKHIYAQLADDDRRVTLLGVSDLSEGLASDGKGKVAKGKAVGKLLAERAKAAGISKVVFDRAGYRYHGRVRAVADGAREGGLEF
jgi:large subunit ribosomal protein L18